VALCIASQRLEAETLRTELGIAASARMTRVELLRFMRRHRIAVQASVAKHGAPQAAIVGIAVGDDFEVVFDTLQTTRKARNLRADPRIAFVFGGWDADEEQTVQYEGLADAPQGADLQRVRDLYFNVHPDGRERLAWPGLIHIRVRAAWLRYSDFARSPEQVLEFSAAELAALE
jgi:general stress protein 26